MWVKTSKRFLLQDIGDRYIYIHIRISLFWFAILDHKTQSQTYLFQKNPTVPLLLVKCWKKMCPIFCPPFLLWPKTKPVFFGGVHWWEMVRKRGWARWWFQLHISSFILKEANMKPFVTNKYVSKGVIEMDPPFWNILLMVQKSGEHQLRLVVYPIIYTVLAPSQVVMVGFLNHQPYVPHILKTTYMSHPNLLEWMLRYFKPCK